MALTDNLVSYWKMENDVTDEQSAGNDGTNNGATFVAGNTGFGQALSFPGGSSNVRVVVPTDASIEMGDSDDFTVSCWVKSVNGSNYPGFVSKNWTDGAGNYKGWILGHWGTSTTPTEGTSPFTNKMYFSPRDGVIADRGFLFTDNTVLDNDWHHLAATRNGTSKLSNLYLDGVLQSDTSTKAMVDTGDDLLFGQYYNYSLTYCLNGNLDEVAIWERSLSAVEILEIYNLGGTGLVPIGSGFRLTIV